MKQNKAIKLAYLAGTIDSDGCITIKKLIRHSYKGGKSPAYTLQISINSPDGRIIDWCYGAFGGSVYKCKPYGFKMNGEPKMEVLRWQIIGNPAAQICKKLIPFLRYKKNQAEEGWRFQCLFNKQNKNLPYRWGRMTEYELEQREKSYQRLKDLKKIFIPSAVVETKRDESSKDDKR